MSNDIPISLQLSDGERERLENACDVFEEYFTRVWDLKWTRSVSRTGSVYYMVQYPVNGQKFNVRISNHPPGACSGLPRVNHPVYEDVIKTLSYIAYKYQLKPTRDIREWREVYYRAQSERLNDLSGSQLAAMRTEMRSLKYALEKTHACAEEKERQNKEIRHELKCARYRINELEYELETRAVEVEELQEALDAITAIIRESDETIQQRLESLTHGQEGE